MNKLGCLWLGTVWLMACAPVENDNTDPWREVTAAPVVKPSCPAGERESVSLGNPFILVAQTVVETSSDHAPCSSFPHVWLMLESDACDVVLRSWHASMPCDAGRFEALTSVTASTGAVREASASHVSSVHRVPIQGQDADGISEFVVDLTVDLSITPDRVAIVQGAVGIPWENDALRFQAVGRLDDTSDAVPSRRLGCW